MYMYWSHWIKFHKLSNSFKLTINNNQAIHVCVDVVIHEFFFNFVKLQIKVWKTFCKIDFDISDFYLFLFSFH